MTTLYELTDNYRNIQDLLGDESMDQQTLTSALALIEGDIQSKAQNIAVILQSMDANISILDAEIKRLMERKKAIEKGNEWLKNYLKEQLEKIGQKKLKTPMFTLSIQNNPPAVQITDEKAIPAKFLTIIPQKTVPDKKRIAESLKAGEKIPGAILTQGKSLRIR